MKRFLQETWELWYWAVFCPSRLQQRMNAWAPVKEKDGQRPDTRAFSILLLRADPRFITQYLLLAVCFSLPLIVRLPTSGPTLDGLLPLSALLTAYGLGIWFLPIGLHSPLIFSLVYWQDPERYTQALTEAWNEVSSLFPQVSQLAGGLAIGTVVLIVSLI